ncbi:probable sodium/metabolite cotransporter BASS4, chloroplastic isoform X2 [Zingiber officinale]|uniref:probable sodium/metabolite cotransporter BASS4, chloroplastic isoform X2 n=1 Tax=Zingiber officinale TaxID=94328 RepID=UPI001C4C0FD1|nr:probable sodium/metabolite cotransporter BASS4, chloroplastic isoform X2 [Zingiber officinale]
MAVAVALRNLPLRPVATSRSSRFRTYNFPSSSASFFSKSLFPVSSPPLYLERFPSLRLPRATGEFDQVGGRGKHSFQDSAFQKTANWTQPLLDFVTTNFLPLALLSGIALGLANPTLGCVAHKFSLSKFSTFGIFFLSGIMLRSRELGAAVEAWPAGLFGLGSILLLTPFFSRLVLQIQLAPYELITGLAAFCCMPTTLSSGVALTQLVGGNTALALAMTVLSNLLGILIVLRDSSESMAEFVDRNRQSLSMLSAVLLSLVPWMQVSRSRPLLLTVKPAVFATAVGMATLLHFLLLAFNIISVKSLSVVSGGDKSIFSKNENARAVIIVSSQKTLPVLVAVVEQLHGALGEPGLLVLPCVAAHIIQIIIDSFIVNLWLRKDQMSAATKEV